MNSSNQKNLSFITLLMLFTFASVSAVLFTPALPNIAQYFLVSTEIAQYTVSLFLLGYTLGQLVYSPIANRFGRKPALYFGIALQIISSLMCILAGVLHQFALLALGRFLLGLGASVGLNMTHTLVSEYYDPQKAKQTVAYLLLASPLIPGPSVALGGILTTHLGWLSCFYANAIHGIIVLMLVIRLPETLTVPNKDAFKIKPLLFNYKIQLTNIKLVSGGFLIGISASFLYIFSTIAPFIAINLFTMSSEQYGLAYLLLPIGLLSGSLCSVIFIRKYLPESIIHAGILITLTGVLLMLFITLFNFPVMFFLFLPMIPIYFGMMLIPASAAAIAMHSTIDKAYGSAIMNFISVGFTTLIIISISFFSIKALLLPIFYLILCVGLIIVYYFGLKKSKKHVNLK